MTKPIATVTFAKDATSVSVTSPQPGYAIPTEVAQARGQTATGTWYVYDKAVTNRRLRLMLLLPESEYIDLRDFYRDTARGSLNTFDFTDHYGTTHSGCRFANDELVADKNEAALYEVELDIILPDDAL